MNNQFIKKKPLPFSVQPPTLQDFIRGDNGEVVDEIQKLIDNSSHTTPLQTATIFIWGDKSVGKSFLLQSALAYARHLNKHVYFIDALKQSVIPPLETNGLLIIDNVNALSDDEQINLFDWCNQLQQPKIKKRLLISSPLSPTDLAINTEVKTRLLSDFVIRLQPLSEDNKKQALITYAKRNGFTLPESIANLFLLYLPRGMDDLALALQDLDQFLLLANKPISEYWVRQWLRNQDTLRTAIISTT